MNIHLPLIFGIFNWRDGIEITFFSIIFYFITLWLAQDTQKNLLVTFYGFCCVMIGAHILGLSTISMVLFIFSPAIVLLFMFMHQNTLQRNLIALKNITLPTLITTDWLTILMRNCLTILHNNQKLLIIIENTDAIETYLKSDYCINAPLSHDLLKLIMDKVYNSHKMIWIRADGTLRGINVSWKASWCPTSYEEPNAWIDDAIAHTSKKDALVLHINPLKQYCSIAFNGILYQELSIEQAHQLIRKKINYPSSATKKGSPYDVINKTNNVAQHSS